MSSIIQLAKDFEEKLGKKTQAAEKLALYAGMLRGLSIIHQQAHWTSRSKEYYGDHLLFDRLYGDVTKHIDTAFEKMIGVFGSDFADLVTHMDNTKKFIDDITGSFEEGDDDELVKRSLFAEEIFLKFSDELYRWLDAKSELTLGLDDMIMSIASDHEGLVYLLKQRLDE